MQASTLSASPPATGAATELAADLLHRREDPDDRRQKRLRCTDAGHQALRRLDEARLAGIAAFAAGVPAAQCRRLSAALRPILDDLPERP